jgi:hypothetical protein
MIPALLLLHLASATPLDTLVRRADQYTKVSADIAQTITDVNALNTTLNGYGYDVSDIGSGLIGTYNGAQAVATDIQNTVNDAKASDPFTSSESQSLYLSLASLLEPTFDLLDNFVAHCNTYTKVGITSIVVSNLQSQRGLVQQESDALAAKVAAPYPQSIAFGAGLILSKFDSALSIFQASSCPPPGSTAFPPSSGGATVTVTAPGGTVTKVSLLPFHRLSLPIISTNKTCSDCHLRRCRLHRHCPRRHHHQDRYPCRRHRHYHPGLQHHPSRSDCTC